MRFILVILFAASVSSCSRPKEDAPEKTVVSVKTARAEATRLSEFVTAPATIFPREQANVAARVTAPIRELRVRKGDHVNAGQVLAVLENRDAAAQRQEAQAAVADAEASLQKTASGTVPSDLERARGQVETSRAALDQAQKTYERRRALFAQGAIPQRDLLQTETELTTARANFEVAQRSLELLQRQSGASDIAMARARLEQARARLASANANLQYTDLRSPFAGTVTDQFQYPGDMAGPATPTLTVMDLSTVTARAQVPETSAARVRNGQPCTFTGTDENITAARGQVTVVNRAVDPARRTVEVWCDIRNPAPSLRSGVFGNLVIETASLAGAIVVPVTAVQMNEGTDTGIVFVVDRTHTARKRDVKVGVRESNRLQIVSGVQAGELVITEGSYSLPDGTEVSTGAAGNEGAKR